MAKLIAFFEKREGRQPTITFACQFAHHLLPFACYKEVEGSKENNSAKDRSSHPISSVKKVFLKILQYTQESICAGVSSK